MPLSTTFGQSPCEVQLLRTPETIQVWLFFDPSEFVQGKEYCFAAYDIEIVLRDSLRIFYRSLRRFSAQSTSTEQLLSSNYLHWDLPLSPPQARWEVLVVDIHRQQVFSYGEKLSPEKDTWCISAFRWGKGFRLHRLSDEQMIWYSVPSGTYLGQAALYQAESSLPQLTRYLSIEERRFTLQAPRGYDSVSLRWRVPELPAGRYLIGLYLYRGEALQFQAYYPALRK